MAEDAGTVAIQFEAKLDAYNAAIAAAVRAFGAAGGAMERSAGAIEGAAARLGESVNAGYSRAADSASRSSGKIEKSTEAAKTAAMSFVSQLSQASADYMSGKSPLEIIAGQGPALVSAFLEITASGEKLGATLKSIALPGFLSVLSILGPVIVKLMEGESAAKDQRTAYEKLTDAVDEFQKRNGQGVQSEYVRLLLLAAGTKRIAEQEVATRKLIQARIEQAKADLEATKVRASGSTQRSEVAAIGVGVQQAQIDQLQSQLTNQDKKIGDAEARARVAGGNLTLAQNQANSIGADKISASAARVAAANNQYALEIGALSDKLARGPDKADSKGRRGIDQDTFDRLSLAALRRLQDKLSAESDQVDLDTQQRRNESRSRQAANIATEKLTSAELDVSGALESFQRSLDAQTESFSNSIVSQFGERGKVEFDKIITDIDDRENKKMPAIYQGIIDKEAEEKKIKELADFYLDAFNGGTKGLFKQFKQEGLKAVATILAKLTVTQFGGGVGGGGGIFGSLFGAIVTAVTGGKAGTGGYTFTTPTEANYLSAFTTGFANGGAFTVGGRHGVDRNMMSINGQPVARVSRGETVAVVPQTKRLSGAPRAAAKEVAPSKTFVVNVSADNSVTPATFGREVVAMALQEAAKMDDATFRRSMANVPARVNRFQQLGS